MRRSASERRHHAGRMIQKRLAYLRDVVQIPMDWAEARMHRFSKNTTGCSCRTCRNRRQEAKYRRDPAATRRALQESYE